MAPIATLPYGLRYSINGLAVKRLPMPVRSIDLEHTGCSVPPTDATLANGRTNVNDPDSTPLTEPMVPITEARANGRLWRLEPFLYQRYAVSFQNLALRQRNPEREDNIGLLVQDCKRPECQCERAYHQATGELTREAGTRGNVKATNGRTSKLLHPFAGDGAKSLPVRGRTHPAGHGDEPYPAGTSVNANETLSLEILTEAEAKRDASESYD